jgi:hypothetical protein
MTSQSEIKRHADGSIDYRHYENLGRCERGRAFAGVAVWVRATLRNSITSIAAVARRAYKAAPSRPSISAPSAS